LTFASCAREEITLTNAEPIIYTDFQDASLENIQVELRDAALHFPNAYDFSYALRAITNATSAEVDEWADRIGFASWAREHREIQARINRGEITSAEDALTKEQSDRFYLEADGALRTLAESRLMSELMNLAGVVYINNSLNHFGKSHHIMLGEEYSLADFRAIRSRPVNDVESKIYVKENDVRNTTDVSDGSLEKEQKYFSCPFFNNATYVWGHRKEETIDGKRQRVIVEINKSIYWTSFNEPLMTFVTAIDVTNEIKQIWGWRDTQPDYDVGTLSSSASSGEVSATSPDQVLRVSRFGSWRKWSGGTQLAHDATNVPMTIGSGFADNLTNAGTYKVIDQVIVGAGSLTASDIQGIDGSSFYSWNSGRISVNWSASRSATMDIQLGCN
jgi:hypothetical protein